MSEMQKQGLCHKGVFGTTYYLKPVLYLGLKTETRRTDLNDLRIALIFIDIWEFRNPYPKAEVLDTPLAPHNV